jgi:hypothetical protein
MLQIVNLQTLQDLMIHGSQLFCALFIKSHRLELKTTVLSVSAEKLRLIQLWHQF